MEMAQMLRELLQRPAVATVTTEVLTAPTAQMIKRVMTALIVETPDPNLQLSKATRG